jgi:hypothetical protein
VEKTEKRKEKPLTGCIVDVYEASASDVAALFFVLLCYGSAMSVNASKQAAVESGIVGANKSNGLLSDSQLDV